MTGDQVPGRSSGVFAGLQTCGSVWHCAVCASKITERRRLEVTEAVERWEALGGIVVLATFTARHRRGQSLGNLVDRLMAARRRHKTGKGAQWARSLVGGSIRATEVTYGAENGWHPHLHELLFLFPGTRSADVAELASDLRGRWERLVQGAGLGTVNEHGFQLVASSAEVAAYVAKWGTEKQWTVAHEIAKQPVKQGRGTSRTPMALLDAYVEGDYLAGSLWREYAEAMKGRRQLVWSPGLAEGLGMPPRKRDEEVAAEREDTAVTIAALSHDEWQVIVRGDLRAELLIEAGSGDRDRVSRWIGARVRETRLMLTMSAFVRGPT
jgi:hypothetical protein